jgi:hypothetical protein
MDTENGPFCWVLKDLFANDPEVTGVWTVVSSIGQVTFGLSLCTNHAYLLRIGCTLTGLSSGL